MLYKIAHILRDKLGWLWNLIEYFNGILFSLKYGKKLKRIAFNEVPAGYVVQTIRTMPTEKLVAFFQHQPEESFSYFHPHGFDAGIVLKGDQFGGTAADIKGNAFADIRP